MRRPVPPSSEIEPQFSCDEVAADPADLAQQLHALVAFSALGDLAGGLGDLAVEIADQRNQAVESAAVRRAVAARRVTRGRLCRTDRRTRVACPGGPAARARGSLIEVRRCTSVARYVGPLNAHPPNSNPVVHSILRPHVKRPRASAQTDVHPRLWVARTDSVPPMLRRASMVVVGLLVLVVPFVLSACGGNKPAGGNKPSGPSRSQTAAVAQRLCGAANQQIAKNLIDITSANAVVFLAASESRLNVIKPMFAEMTRIKASDDQKGKWNAFIAAQRHAVDAMQSLRTFVATKPTAGGDAVRAQFQDKAHEILSTGDGTKTAATAYGLPECARGPYLQSRVSGGATKDYVSSRVGVEFSYPAGWRQKLVNGESPETSVAFGDDSSDCGITVNQRAAPSSELGYARQQASSAMSTADSYSLIKVAPVRSSNGITGAEIVRRATIKGKTTAAHIAFFFGGGKRWVVDCVTSDVANFSRIDAEQFAPLIAGFVAIEKAPK